MEKYVLGSLEWFFISSKLHKVQFLIQTDNKIFSWISLCQGMKGFLIFASNISWNDSEKYFYRLLWYGIFLTVWTSRQRKRRRTSVNTLALRLRSMLRNAFLPLFRLNIIPAVIMCAPAPRYYCRRIRIITASFPATVKVYLLITFKKLTCIYSTAIIHSGKMGEPISQWLADRIGWREMASEVAKVYKSLPAKEKQNAVIISSN